MLGTLILTVDIRPRRFHLRTLLARLLAMAGGAPQRRALAGLDDRLLSDVGISRADAAREIRKPFWQV